MRLGLALAALLASTPALAPLAAHEPQGSSQRLLPVDRSMFDTAAATGGDFYFWSRDEFARSKLEIPLGGEDLFLGYGELDGERSLEFPVEPLLARVDVFVGAQRLEQVRFLRPDGTEAVDGERARIQTFEHMRIATFDAPRTGSWRVVVRGAGLASLSVRGSADTRSLAAGELEPILLVDVDRVEPGGRPGHEGLFPVERPPRAGEQALARVCLSGSFGSAELGFVGLDGQALDQAWIPLDFAEGGDEAYAPFDVPRVPFRAVVRGLDVSGAPFQRVDAPCIAPERE